MRYFLLLPCPVTLLPGGIIRATRARGLVFRSGSLNGFLSGFLAATIGTIPLAAITAATDDDLGVAATTVVETTGYWHRQKMSMRAGFNPIVCDT